MEAIDVLQENTSPAQSQLSCFHLALDKRKHIPRLRLQAADAIRTFGQKQHEHSDHIREHLEGMPEINNRRWKTDSSDSAAPAPLAKGYPRKTLFNCGQAAPE